MEKENIKDNTKCPVLTKIYGNNPIKLFKNKNKNNLLNINKFIKLNLFTKITLNSEIIINIKFLTKKKKRFLLYQKIWPTKNVPTKQDIQFNFNTPKNGSNEENSLNIIT